MREGLYWLGKKQLILPLFILLCVVMFILPFYSADGYSIIRHTTSQLGAQLTPNAWVMNLMFMAMGLACILEGWLHLKGFWFHKVVISVFGIGLMMTAVFHHAPIDEGLAFNVREDMLHSVFATIVGFSFTLFSVSTAFIVTKNKERAVSVLVAFMATGLSLLMAFIPQYSGVWQRLIFIISFTWLVVFFKSVIIK